VLQHTKRLVMRGEVLLQRRLGAASDGQLRSLQTDAPEQQCVSARTGKCACTPPGKGGQHDPPPPPARNCLRQASHLLTVTMTCWPAACCLLLLLLLVLLLLLCLCAAGAQ
jgi:hypothetical protein